VFADTATRIAVEKCVKHGIDVCDHVHAISSSVELKAKFDNYFHNNRSAPLVVITTMPHHVLAKFVKYIIFHQQQAGVSC
jgi:hypothetical protein